MISPALRPRRSVLFMPGSNPRALEKARELPADGLIFDLEDAVAPDMKEVARRNVGAAMQAGGYGRRELIVRINPPDGEWGSDDLAAAAAMPINAVLLPKVESVASVKRALEMLEALRAPDTLALWCMIETPRGVLAAAEIAGASERVAVLVLGTSDLTKDLHVIERRDRLPLMTALGLVLLAARAHRRAVLDGVHLDLADHEGFEMACRHGRELGFDGKTLIHPQQIAPANAAFGPSADEIANARRLVTAYAEAVAAGQGAARIDGRLVEALHIEEAERILALAEVISG
ncbi:MAG: CoA ester lyase [Alphaproteobacteria bacterium]|nr:CoA ester lyase [Alphaproteobacteria bacterium]